MKLDRDDAESVRLLTAFVLADDALQAFLLGPANFHFTEDWAALHKRKNAARAALDVAELGK